LACGGSDATSLAAWSVVVESPSAALLSVSGRQADDVWMVGADAGDGPVVLHWDGAEWERKSSGARADLWWVHVLPVGSVYLAGAGATVLREQLGAFERMHTPGLAKHIVFGVWGSSDDDVYAVGSAQGRNGFVWHYAGSSWADLPLPSGLPQDENSDIPGFFKVWGSTGSDVWVVGDRGVVLRGNARDGFGIVPSGSDEQLFTVHGAGGRVAMVGGSGNGWALEGTSAGLAPITPPGSGLLQGVHVTQGGDIWAVGVGGNVHVRDGSTKGWRDLMPGVPVQSLHAVWVDPEGGAWAVGGNALTRDLDAGVALRYQLDGKVSPVELPRAEVAVPSCPEAAIDPLPEASIARRWNEQLLNAVRRDLPRPTVHARNLFHVSVALWDAWAAYDADADAVVTSERHTATDLPSARREAISYAAYRVLSQRHARGAGAALSRACFDAFMQKLGYDAGDTEREGASPRAVGNRIGFAIIAAFADDGANEPNDYADPAQYAPDNPRLVVDLPGTRVRDPLQWQELELSDPVTQNGIPLTTAVQTYMGAHWGQVLPFAIERPAAGAPYFELAAPPFTLDQAADEVLEVIRRGAELESDFARVVAEYWANGPSAETPPGHWNALASAASYHPSFERRLLGTGGSLDPLAWDVHLYLALNAALHDAAIAAWELKRRHVGARPITLIRHLGGLGQRTLPDAPAYHPQGLPLVDGLIEVVTEQSVAEAERHAHLARYVGEIAVRAWRGEPGDPERDVGGIAWVRAKDWVPYQARSFVTPAFPGHVSAHSTFSRAAAVVLERLTGSSAFPGGQAGYRAEPGSLALEMGPFEPVELMWRSYADAAAQAGESGLLGGIATPRDDVEGQRVGAEVGRQAVERAARHFVGSALP
jgi:hypothetical protein